MELRGQVPTRTRATAPSSCQHAGWTSAPWSLGQQVILTTGLSQRPDKLLQPGSGASHAPQHSLSPWTPVPLASSLPTGSTPAHVCCSKRSPQSRRSLLQNLPGNPGFWLRGISKWYNQAPGWAAGPAPRSRYREGWASALDGGAARHLKSSGRGIHFCLGSAMV